MAVALPPCVSATLYSFLVAFGAWGTVRAMALSCHCTVKCCTHGAQAAPCPSPDGTPHPFPCPMVWVWKLGFIRCTKNWCVYCRQKEGPGFALPGLWAGCHSVTRPLRGYVWCVCGRRSHTQSSSWAFAHVLLQVRCAAPRSPGAFADRVPHRRFGGMKCVPLC